jgi:hypothetical protein
VGTAEEFDGSDGRFGLGDDMKKGPLFSPLHWHILLWYYSRQVKYANTDPDHSNSRAVRDYTNQLIAHGLIQSYDDDTDIYVATGRGRALVEFLFSLPLPIQSWHIPNE